MALFALRRQRVLLVSSAASANALPVAEFTIAMILLTGKDTFSYRDLYRDRRAFTVGESLVDVGNFRRRIGVIGASRIGRRVLELLRPYDFEVALTDPYVTGAPPGVRLTDVEEVLRSRDVGSVHAPESAATRHPLDRPPRAL